MIWWILPAGVVLFGCGVMFSAIRRLRNGDVGSGGVGAGAGCLVFGVAGVMGLIGLNLQTYARLNNELPVANVTIAQNGPQTFQAIITYENVPEPKEYMVKGDELRMEARILKWAPWASIVGYDSVYRLDRLSGRYTDTEDERTGERTIYDLTENPGVDIWKLVRDNGSWLKSVDAHYGTGTYFPMIDQANYRVLMTNSGLIARAGNDVAREGLNNWSQKPEGPRAQGLRRGT